MLQGQLQQTVGALQQLLQERAAAGAAGEGTLCVPHEAAWGGVLSELQVGRPVAGAPAGTHPPLLEECPFARAGGDGGARSRE